MKGLAETNQLKKLSIQELQSAQVFLSELEKTKREKMREEETEARKLLSPKYQIKSITRCKAVDNFCYSYSKIGVEYTYKFVLTLTNDDEYEAHFQKYRRIDNRPDMTRISVDYFWVPVTEKIGVIGHTGGGHIVLTDYMKISWNNWLKLVTLGILTDNIFNCDIVHNNNIEILTKE